MNEIDKKKCLRMFSYGIYVLSSIEGSRLCASTVTWVSQASFSPPLISVCIKKNTLSYEIVKDSRSFILHIPGEDQKDLASAFFKPSSVEDSKINGHSFKIVNGLPLIKGFPAYLVCSVENILEEGDHPLFLASVKDAVVIEDVCGLELSSTGWSYGG
jgi:flavin reductase (DIM6/NTAB) family NADH-FMN oxidoreductase RutF